MTQETTIKNTSTGSSRREFLGLTLFVSLGLLVAKFLDISLDFGRPRVAEGEFGGAFELGPVVELPTPDMAPVNYPEGRFFLARTEDRLLALHKVCTHLDCLFDWDEQDGTFVCPCHASKFARDGAYISGPAARSLDRFVVQLTTPEGNVVVQTDLTNGSPLPIPVDSDVADAAEIAEADSDEEVDQIEDPDLQVVVDTGQKILGEPVV